VPTRLMLSGRPSSVSAAAAPARAAIFCFNFFVPFRRANVWERSGMQTTRRQGQTNRSKQAAYYYLGPTKDKQQEKLGSSQGKRGQTTGVGGRKGFLDIVAMFTATHRTSGGHASRRAAAGARSLPWRRRPRVERTSPASWRGRSLVFDPSWGDERIKKSVPSLAQPLGATLWQGALSRREER
jgi:hypothetical protein